MKPFYKIPSEGVFTGVCAGIAAYTGMPAIFVRVLFVCFSQFLFLPYVVMAICADSDKK